MSSAAHAVGRSGPNVNRLSLGAGFTWAFVANAVYAASQWSMLVILTKTSSPETVGRFILALAITGPIVLFTNLQLRSIQAADPLQQRGFASYFTLRAVSASIAFAAVVLVAFVGGWSRTTVGVIVAVGLFKTVESFSDVAYGLFQQSERMDYIGRSLMVRGPCAAIVLAVTFGITRSLPYACGAVAVAWLIVFYVNDRPRASSLAKSGDGVRNSWICWNRRELLNLARLGLPLGITAMLWMLNTNIPRYLMDRRYGERELGVFGAIAYVHVAGTTVVGALGQSAIPRLAAYFSAGRLAEFRRLLARALLFAGLIGISCICVAATSGKSLLTALYSAEYGEYHRVFTLQMCASCCAYVVSILECGLNSVGCLRPQFVIVLGTTLITALSSSLTLPAFGIIAVPLSMIGGYFMYLVMSGLLLRTVYRRRRCAG